MTESGNRLQFSDKVGVETVVLATPNNNRIKMTEKADHTGRTNITIESNTGDIIFHAPNGRVHIESLYYSKDIGQQPAAAATKTAAHGSPAPHPSRAAQVKAWRKTHRAAIRRSLANQRVLLLHRKAQLTAWNDKTKAQSRTWFGSDSLATRQALLNRTDRELALNNSMTTKNFQPPEPGQQNDSNFAYVHPADPTHTIYLDHQFDVAKPIGQDSQAGTLAHEMSHFRILREPPTTTATASPHTVYPLHGRWQSQILQPHSIMQTAMNILSKASSKRNVEPGPGMGRVAEGRLRCSARSSGRECWPWGGRHPFLRTPMGRLFVVPGLSLLLAASSGCQAKPTGHAPPTGANSAAVQKGSVVNLQISVTVDTNDGHVLAQVAWKNLSETETCLSEPWQLFRANLMEGSLLQISSEGRKVEFLGAMVKRKATPEKDLVRLGPGQSLQAQQDITNEYQFAAGTHTYSVEYAAFLAVSPPRKDVIVRSSTSTFTLTR